MRNILVTITSAIFVLLVVELAKSCIPDTQAQTVYVPVTPTPLIDPDADLRQHAERSLSLSNPKISPARRLAARALLVDVATRVFKDRMNQRYWIALIGVESGYDGRARSSRGAVGLGQLIPSYRNDFGAACSLGDVSEEDVRDDYTNALLSACYFKSLIDQNHGDLSLALVAYNAGINSQDFKKAKRGEQPSKEPREYRLKIKERASL
jgi:soluble lytic murein transglycosylase-like protein